MQYTKSILYILTLLNTSLSFKYFWGGLRRNQQNSRLFWGKMGHFEKENENWGELKCFEEAWEPCNACWNYQKRKMIEENIKWNEIGPLKWTLHINTWTIDKEHPQKSFKMSLQGFPRPHEFQELPDKDNLVIVHQKRFSYEQLKYLKLKARTLFELMNNVPNFVERTCSLKTVSTTFLLIWFSSLKESTSEIWKNIFLFHFKSTFCSRENQGLEF